MNSGNQQGFTGRTGPLSHGQRALWFLQQLAPDNCAYNIAVAARITGPLDAGLLSVCFKSLVDRHASLRTIFPANKGKPIQLVRDSSDIEFDTQDGSGVAWDDAKSRLIAVCQKPFDLEHGPVLRITLLKRSNSESVLLLVVHHIAIDYSSVVQLFRELGALYAASGSVAALPPLRLTYVDYAEWQNEMLTGPRGARLWEYWSQQLSGELPVINLPVDFRRHGQQTFRGDTYHFDFGVLTSPLRRLVRETDGSLYTVLLSAVFAMLHLCTGQDDLLIGSPPIGRRRNEFNGVVGFFHNPVVLRSRLRPGSTFRRLHGDVTRTAEQALEHSDYPFSYLVERLNPSRDPSISPIFQVMFVLYDGPADAAPLGTAGECTSRMDFGGLELEFIEIEDAVSMLDMTLTFVDEAESLSASIQYNTDLFESATIERIALDLTGIIEAAAARPDLFVEDLMVTARNRVPRTARIQEVCDRQVNPGRSENSPEPGNEIELSLLCLARYSDGGLGDDGFTLLTEAARFADRNGFRALWLLSEESNGRSRTCASSAVMGAAVAVLTERIDIRGTVAFQLQNPVRLAEEWSVVDNLSHGRAAIAFVWPGPLGPPPSLVEGGCDENAFLKVAGQVQGLWRGDSMNFPGVDGKEVRVKTLPRPVKTPLPLWVLARDPDGGRLAAELSAGLLIDLRIASPQDLTAIIQTYRQTPAPRGDSTITPGPEGRVAAVVPTFVSVDGEKSAMAQSFAETSVPGPIGSRSWGRTLPACSGLSLVHDPEDPTALHEHEAAAAGSPGAPARSVESANDIQARILCGTPDQCIEKIMYLKGLGIDEIACWIDFGLDHGSILSGFDGLRQVVEYWTGLAAVDHAQAGQFIFSLEPCGIDDPMVDAREVDAARERARARRDLTRRRQKLISPGTSANDDRT
jgi:alkanesulfonate monooxygenase SsuD/methylene tetrahydromethanopterin reductase-like flavin-dependent oxidoreductase (luciferase family)